MFSVPPVSTDLQSLHSYYCVIRQYAVHLLLNIKSERTDLRFFVKIHHFVAKASYGWIQKADFCLLDPTNSRL